MILSSFLSFHAEAVPKRILDQMQVDGLTRENVASHLQVRLDELRTSYGATYGAH